MAPLERRQLMAAGGLGINLDSRLDYVDVMKESNAWTAPGGGAVATDANGWPLADSQVIVLDERLNQPWNGPDPNAVQPDIGGTYHLTFQGSATVAPAYLDQYNFLVQNQVYNAATNTTTADVDVFHYTSSLLALSFTNTVNPASPTGKGVTDVRLIQPGYAADTTQVFTDNLVNALGPFSTVRYLNVDGANAPSSTPYANYQSYTTPTFTIPAGTHTITLQGMDGVGDGTILLDAISMHTAGDETTTTSLGGNGVPLDDAGFESPAQADGNLIYDPTGTAWTYTGPAGVTTSSTAYTWFTAAPPEGRQVGFLQDLGSASQDVNVPAAGSYTISLSAQARFDAGSIQSLQVLVDGKPVGQFTPKFGGVTPLEWSQRKLPTASSQASGPGAPGVSWEDMIALANASNTDMWINIPGTASDDYITQLANLIKNGDTVGGVHYAGLKPNLKVYLEFSNEVWGGIQGPFVDNLEAAAQEALAGGSKLNSDGNGDVYTWAQRRYLERTMQATTIFRSVLGADPSYDKIRPVITSQGWNYWYYTGLLPWFEQAYGAPSQYFYALSNTNYVNPTDFSSVDNLIASLYAQIPQQAATASHFVAVANYYGLHYLTYEGGPVTAGPSSPDAIQVSLAASRDPRMEDFVVQFYQAWFAAGADLTTVYDGPYGSNGPGNQYALAEMAQAADPSASPKYRGFVDLSRAVATPLTMGTAVSAVGVTSLSTAADSFGAGFTAPVTGQVNYWTINVARAGNYALNLQTAAGTSGGRVSVGLSDTNTLATYDLGSATGHSLGLLALHAGLNTLALTTRSPFSPTALTLTAPSALGDAGFESVAQVAGPLGYTYDPTGSAWTFAGPAGVTGNGSGFTSLNSAAPQGSQVAFLQNQGSISQTVAGLAAGSYTISFQAAQRAGANTTAQSFQVFVDGVAVAAFRPSGTSYQPMSTAAFSLSAGPHTISFQGLNPWGDATAFLDAIALTPSTTTAPPLSDGNFEALHLSSGSFLYNPTGSPWSFAGSAGLTTDATGFTWLTPSGSQVAFLQNQGSISQTVAGLAAGSYTLSLDAVQRNGSGAQSFRVLVDGAPVAAFFPTGSSYQRLKTASFALSAGQHTITLQGLNTLGDQTVLLDNVSLDPVTS